MIKRYFNSGRVFFIGDIHGNFQSIQQFIELFDIRDSVLILCGDIGLGFMKRAYYERIFKESGLTKCLESRNITVYFMRGNHDDPSYYDGSTIASKRIICIPDYSVLTIDSHSILCVGGGLSIDRNQRKANNSINIRSWLHYHPEKTEKDALEALTMEYWEDELPVHPNPDFYVELDVEDIHIDTVCTHSAPLIAPPEVGGAYFKAAKAIDKDLEADNRIERSVLQDLMDNLKKYGHPVKYWIYGHYHIHNFSVIDNVEFHLLDRMRDGNLDVKELYER